MTLKSLYIAPHRGKEAMIRLEADKSYAYLLGVYLGDGCVTGGRYSQNTIDSDFKDAVVKAANDISDSNVCVYYTEKPKKDSKCRPSWNLSFSDKELTDKLVFDTESKRKIPDYVFAWTDGMKKQFIIGLMDSEGFVAKNHNHSGYEWKATNRSFYMGYKSCDLWVDELIDLMHSIGLKTGKCGVEKNDKLPNRKPSKRFHVKMQSWVDAGMRFNIARKQSRVDEWASIGPYERRAKHPRRLISETSMPRAVNG